MISRTSTVLVAVALVLAACSSDDASSPQTVADESVSTSEAETDSEPVADATSRESVEEAVEDEVTETPVDTEAPVDEPIDASVTVEASPYIGLAAAVEITLPEAAQVEVTATSGDHVVEVPRTAAVADAHTVPLVGMRVERSYDIEVEAFDAGGTSMGVVGDGEFTTTALPDYFADHVVTSDPDRASPGYTVFEFDSLAIPEGAVSSQHLMAYDNEGEVVWYYTNTGSLGGVEMTPAGTINIFYWPFGVREIDLLGNLVGHWRPQPSDTEGDVVDNELVIAEVDPDQVDFNGGLGAFEGNPGDIEPLPVRADWIDLAGVHHEAWPMPNGNILTLSTTEHELTQVQRDTLCPGDEFEFNAVSDVAVEFEPDGRVVRTWDLWDVIDIDEHPGIEMCVITGIFAGDTNRDWLHANSVTYDPVRDAILISSRHTNQIIALNHLDDEGPQADLRWILGEGATMPYDGDLTYYQHAVEVNADGSLVLYDNGNVRPGTAPGDVDNPQFSRAVIIEVDDASSDPAEWSARQRWEHIDLDDDGVPIYTQFIGDADVLENGNVLVNHGGIGLFPPNPENPLRILTREIVPTGDSGGDVVWELRSASGGGFWLSYRAERIPSFYAGDDWIPRSN